MINFQAHRTKLERRLERKQLRDEASLAARQRETARCTHTKQRFTETIRSDNESFEGSAYFIVLACVTCRIKKYIELVVER